MSLDKVAGECPMGCGRTLFLGNGGHVTCSLLGCPSPCAVDDLLHCVVDPREQRPAVSPAAAQIMIEPGRDGRELHAAHLRAAEARMDAYLRGDRRDGSAHAAYEEEMDQRASVEGLAA